MLLWADLGPRLPPGHEQQGGRPVLLVGVPSKLGPARFPMLIVAPVTSDRDQPWAQSAPTLYPRLEVGVGGLPRSSLVLLVLRPVNN
jgi:mRNA interferase MazF